MQNIYNMHIHMQTRTKPRKDAIMPHVQVRF